MHVLAWFSKVLGLKSMLDLCRRIIVGIMCDQSFIMIYSSFGGTSLFAHIYRRSILSTTILVDLSCDLYLEGWAPLCLWIFLELGWFLDDVWPLTSWTTPLLMDFGTFIEAYPPSFTHVIFPMIWYDLMDSFTWCHVIWGPLLACIGDCPTFHAHSPNTHGLWHTDICFGKFIET